LCNVPHSDRQRCDLWTNHNA